MNKFDDFNSMLRQDDTMFHYTKGSVVLENILFTKQFRYSSLNNTNDPREYKYWFYGAHGYGGLSSNKDLDKKRRIAGQKLDRIRRFDFKVGGFCSNRLALTDTSINNDTENCDTKLDNILGYAKPRMWSQYGENHYGICLAFSIQCMVEAIKNQLGNKAIFFHHKVEYSNAIPYNVISLDANDLIEKDDSNIFALNHIKKCYKEVFFIKHTDYKDEDEFRFIIYYPTEEYFYLDISTCILAVIVGDRFHEIYTPLIEQFCSTFNVEYRRLSWNHGEPALLLR